MKFTEFRIKNFKGIEDITINLDKSPTANIYTLVGLNESGKTTILQAINFFNPSDKGISALELPDATIKDYNSLIPISQRDNFNDTIAIEVTLKLDQEDLDKINAFVKTNSPFRQVQPVQYLKYYRYYRFEDSKFKQLDILWDGFKGLLKTARKVNYISISSAPGQPYQVVNNQLSRLCFGLIPSILYFPNFLFDFPSQIYLETQSEPSPKEKLYLELRVFLILKI